MHKSLQTHYHTERVSFLPDVIITVMKCILTHVEMLIEGEGNGVGCMVCLHLVEKVHLACHLVKMDRTDDCHVCFTTREYASGETSRLLDAALLMITEVFLCHSPNKSMKALYH